MRRRSCLPLRSRRPLNKRGNDLSVTYSERGFTPHNSALQCVSHIREPTERTARETNLPFVRHHVYFERASPKKEVGVCVYLPALWFIEPGVEPSSTHLATDWTVADARRSPQRSVAFKWNEATDANYSCTMYGCAPRWHGLGGTEPFEVSAKGYR